DLEVVERRLERLEASIGKQRKEPEIKERDLLVRIKAGLESERPLRAETLTADEDKLLRGFTFLSAKPIFHIANLDEKALPEGTRAQDAAGVVHSDIARGFIRAEVNGYDELVAAGGAFADLRAKGQLRLEGKDYIVRDGEVCHFRFNVAK